MIYILSMKLNDADEAALDAELDDLLRDENEQDPTPAQPVLTAPAEGLSSQSTLACEALSIQAEAPPSALIAELDADGLAAALEKVCHRANLLREPLPPLAAEYRDIGLRLNELRLRAPRFRPRIQLPRAKLVADQQEISVIQRLIDLHWLHCNGYRDEIDDVTFRGLMIADDFDFEGATAFFRTRWKSRSRAGMMALRWSEQVALRSLLSDEVRTAWHEVEVEARGVRRALREAAGDSGRHLQAREVADFLDLWKAGEILRRNPAGDSPTLAQLARLHGWMRGAAPLGGPTISDKRRRLIRWLKR